MDIHEEAEKAAERAFPDTPNRVRSLTLAFRDIYMRGYKDRAREEEN